MYEWRGYPPYFLLLRGSMTYSPPYPRVENNIIIPTRTVRSFPSLTPYEKKVRNSEDGGEIWI